MWWPWFLCFGLFILGLGRLVKDKRCQWIAGLWCIGIIAMQAPIVEPWRWFVAFSLWTLIALFVGLRVGASLPALIMMAVPVGYAGMAVDHFVALGTEGRIISFAITEAPGVAAVIVGGSGIPNGLRRLTRAWRGQRRGVGILGARRAIRD